MKRFETWLEGQIKYAKDFHQDHNDSEVLNMESVVGLIRTLEHVLWVYRDFNSCAGNL